MRGRGISEGWNMRIATIALAATLLASPVAAQNCPTPGKAEVDIRTPVVEVALNAVPEPVAYAPFPKAMETSLGPGWTINGLTVVRPLVKTQLFTEDAASGGSTCVWVKKAVVSFGFFEPASIYVSSNYKPGSCEYEAIKTHENQHVGIHLNTRMKHVPLMRARIQEALDRAGPIKAADASVALRKIQGIVSEAVDDGIRAFQIETGRLNAVIDSTDSYLRLQSTCSNW